MRRPLFHATRSLLLCLIVAAASVTTAAPSATAQSAEPLEFDYFPNASYNADIPTPEAFLGRAIGDRFTRAHDALAYFERLSAQSDRIQLTRYGQSHQGRPLVIATISSPQNLARLDDILADNRRLADPGALSAAERDAIIAEAPAIVWFSYSVHGNEPSTTEAALVVAHQLVAGDNEDTQRMLRDTIVVIDPCLNPDGRQRYIAWFENTMGVHADPHPTSSEHEEPWPGGRSNHYMFDLNRDWVWMTQPESASRVPIYRQYLPHLHLDYHEQGYMSPYFMGAGDTPYNENIPASTRAWTERYGQANAEVFDARGLIFSTKERFDYLYPGYGKVLPCYHGAVGLLLEQGGHSRGGLTIEIDDRYDLTLRERTRNHYLTSMNYIDMTSRWRSEQLARFAEFFVESSATPEGEPVGYAVYPDNDPALLERLWRLLDGHGIEVHQLTASASAQGVVNSILGAPDGSTGATEQLPAGAWIIRADQPLGFLVRTLFDRSQDIEDPDTYDITAWSAPVVFGLNAASYTALATNTQPERITDFSPTATVTGEGNVALIVSSQQHRFPAALGMTRELDLSARVASRPFTLEQTTYPAGSMVVHAIRNPHTTLGNIADAFAEAGVSSHRAASSMAEVGPVLGANANRDLRNPRVAIARGAPGSSLSYGQTWWAFDHEFNVPLTQLNSDRVVRSGALDDFTTLILPSGSWGSRFGGADPLKQWVREGGVLVAIGSAATWATRDIAGAEPDDDAEDDFRASDLSFEQRRQRSVNERTPGATMRLRLDTTHPLTCGLPEFLGVVKRNDDALDLSSSGFALARYDFRSRRPDARSENDTPRGGTPLIGGLFPNLQLTMIGNRPAVTLHRVGRGWVACFQDDPSFRAMQPRMMRLLMNTALLGPSF